MGTGRSSLIRGAGQGFLVGVGGLVSVTGRALWCRCLGCDNTARCFGGCCQLPANRAVLLTCSLCSCRAAPAQAAGSGEGGRGAIS